MSSPAPTVWDVVLSPSPTAAPQRGSGRVSARSTYQQVLHDRVLLVDLRDADERRDQGEVDRSLAPHYVTGPDLAGWLADQHPGDPVVLLSGRGVRAAAAQRWLARRLATPVLSLDGGFRAWREAGLPTAVEVDA